ncbi:MAG: T9SS type A sorting domain-containing protein [Bacteroidales bacterium]|jgi:hypothetical protein|nr:T9SS type A sorting domain-containing protein [Bacteroidales bacterium]
MKNLLLLLTFSFCLFTLSAQEYADFEITGTNEGTGTFSFAALSNFSWEAIGAINALQIRDDEVFDDGNTLENIFGQADYAENIRIQNYPNGEGMAGYPVVSISQLTLNFDEITPTEGWGFCLVDVDVENCLISAIDNFDNEVPIEDIDRWLIELFDANNVDFGVNIPKWDASHAALLGSDTPTDYLVYNNLVIGGLDDSEAATGFFMPDIPLKSLTIVYENLQETHFTSYHFYLASLGPTRIKDTKKNLVHLYPNPASTSLTFQLTSPSHTLNTINIFDRLGKVVLQTEIRSNKHTIDISYLPGGMYFAQIIVNGKLITKKVIIKH